MKKTILILFNFIFFVNLSFSQSEYIKSLVEDTNKKELDISGLTEFAKNKLKDKKELASFFYYWIGSNIKYDNLFLEDMSSMNDKDFFESQESENVYKNKKGICSGYANLFETFMNNVGIESQIITGHIRDRRNHYVEINSDDDFSHAWNAIKINNKWMLLDTTWGTSSDSLKSDFYFDIKPEWAIISHYPEKKEWQLLKKPLTLQEFNKSKFVNAFWFFVGFTDIPKLMSDKDYYYFVFTKNSNPEWSPYLLYSSDNIEFKNIRDLQSINQDGKTYYKFKKSLTTEKSFFKVNLSHLKNNQMTTYKDIINFKI